MMQTCRKAYELAFKLLHQLNGKTTPAAKLAVVRNLADEICVCVDRAYTTDNGLQPNEKIRIQSDDLVVLFAYMMIQADCESILTDLEFVEDFVSARIRYSLDDF